MKKLIKTTKAFSLAELMIVMLILTIILAATMPILSKRAKVKAAAAATVVLPTATENGTCTIGNIGISSDGTTLLTCQGGVWKKPSSGGVAAQSLYIYGGSQPPSSSNTPAACPSGWTSAGFGWFPTENDPTWGTGNAQIRSCYNQNAICSTLYTYGGSQPPSSSNTPAACPSGWTSAGLGWFPTEDDPTWGTGNAQIRSCYKCS